MSNYLVDLMTWSHSRLKCYAGCPYQFYLKYLENLDEAPTFFAEYGSLIHDILARYYQGRIVPEEAQNEFMISFVTDIESSAPSADIHNAFFKSGVVATGSPSLIDGNILGIEQRFEYDVCGRPFIGFVDMVYEDRDGALVILDHKSRSLKPRSTRKKPTLTDIELDDYLKQLYLYSIPIRERYGRYPDFLEFNCYRTGTRIKERFYEANLDATKQWAVDTIETIRHDTRWAPSLEYFKCRNLCGFYNQCEYAQMCRG